MASHVQSCGKSLLARGIPQTIEYRTASQGIIHLCHIPCGENIRVIRLQIFIDQNSPVQGKFRITRQVRDPEGGNTGVPRTQLFAGTTQLKVFFGKDETIIGLSHRRQALLRHLRQRRLVQQHAIGSRRAASHASTQLVQLRQA